MTDPQRIKAALGTINGMDLPAAAAQWCSGGWHPIELHGVSRDGECSCGSAGDHGAGKHPIGAAWQTAALDRRAIELSLRRATHPRNIGLRMGIQPDGDTRLLAVDVDDPAALARYQADHGDLPLTLTFRTGGGGSHLIYRVPIGIEIPNRSGVHGGIDLRCDGAQIVAPPSKHASGVAYEVAEIRGIADLPPEHLAALCAPKPIPAAPAPASGVPLRSSSDVIERARQYVARMDPAIQGSGGSIATMRAAVAIARGFALDRADAIVLMREYSARCSPPWSEREIAHKIDDAIGRGRLPMGYLRDAPRDREPTWQQWPAQASGQPDPVEAAEATNMDQTYLAAARKRIEAAIKAEKPQGAPPHMIVPADDALIDRILIATEVCAQYQCGCDLPSACACGAPRAVLSDHDTDRLDAYRAPIIQYAPGRCVRVDPPHADIDAPGDAIWCRERLYQTGDVWVTRSTRLLGRVDLEATGGAPVQHHGAGHSLSAAMAARAQQPEPVTTGYADYDAALGGGLAPGLHMLLGGTGSGKSQLALSMILAAARQGVRCVYVALELESSQSQARLIGEIQGVSWSRIWTGHTRASDDAMAELASLPISIEASTPYAWSTDRMGQIADYYGRIGQRVMIVLDYLQIVSGDSASGDLDIRERVAAVSYAARAAAARHGAIIVAVSSVARDKYGSLTALVDSLGSYQGPTGIVRTIANPDPLIGLGKESGEIEYAADSQTVLLRCQRGLGPGALLMALATAKVRTGRPSWAALVFSGGRWAAATGYSSAEDLASDDLLDRLLALVQAGSVTAVTDAATGLHRRRAAVVAAAEAAEELGLLVPRVKGRPWRLTPAGLARVVGTAVGTVAGPLGPLAEPRPHGPVGA